MQIQLLDNGLTVKEPERHKVCQSNQDRSMFDVFDLEGDQDTSSKHDRGNSETEIETWIIRSDSTNGIHSFAHP